MAQTPILWGDYQQATALEEDYDETDETGDENQRALYENLKAIAEQPIDLLTATREDLEQLPFLSDKQIEALMAYLYLHRPMRSLSELKLIPQLDEETIRQLRLFVTLNPTTKGKASSTFKEAIKELHHQVDTRLDIPLYYRAGYSMPNGYVGDPLYHRLRYTLSVPHCLKAGIRLEKDPGERFADSWGGYAMVLNTKCITKAIIGDYRLGLGQGLVMGGNTWTAKSLTPLRSQQGISPATGTDEYHFLRGAAATLNLTHGFSLTAFASYRKLDATLTKDSVNPEVQTFLTSGYHRTSAEREKRNNVGAMTAGGDLTWRRGMTQIGIAGMYQHYSKALCPVSPDGDGFARSYRRYYPFGTHFAATSLHYSTSVYRWSFAGEMAYSTPRKGFATTNRVQWIASEKWRLTLAQRYYSTGYYSPYARALSESGGVRNENAATLYVQGQGLKGWTVNAYFDLFYNVWPRYQMTHSSMGQDLMVQGTRSLGRRNTLLLRYQLKRKEAHDVMENHQRMKMLWTLTPSSSFRSQATAVVHHLKGSTGIGVGETLQSAWRAGQWKTSFTLFYFHTTDFQSRVYLYEPALYATVYSPTLYGHGTRTAAILKWATPNRLLTLEGKIGVTKYFDRSEQGSGLQAIHGSWKSDISLQGIVKLGN